MSITERLSADFQIQSRSTAEGTTLQLNGTLETRDQLDALVEALGVMREWLPEQSADQTERTEV